MINWKVPLSDIDFDEAEIEAAVKVLRSKWLTMGAMTGAFENKFASYLGVKHAFAVANCTAALHIAHQILDVGPGAEVICPSLTFVATANSILYTGAEPVFADIQSLDNLNISPEAIEKAITPRTRVITVVHYGGYPCDMDAILDIARRNNLSVVEDVAHAIGAEYKGKKCGTLGDVGCFSFFSNKNMTTGEGGMIVTNRDDLAEKIRRVRSHGMTTLTWDRHRGHASSYDVVDLGYNYRIDEIRSALGLVQLEKLDRNNAKRAGIVRSYRERLSALKGTQIPFLNYEGNSSYHLFPILLPSDGDRHGFIEYMRGNGIQTSIHYPPVHQFSYYKERLKHRCVLPFTDEVGRRIVTLPLFPAMGEKEVSIVVDVVIKYFASDK